MAINRLREAQRNLRRVMISTLLEQHNWNVRTVAKQLGVTRDCLHWNIRQLDIVPAKCDSLAARLRLNRRAGIGLDPSANKARPNQHEAKKPSPAASTMTKQINSQGIA